MASMGMPVGMRPVAPVAMRPSAMRPARAVPARPIKPAGLLLPTASADADFGAEVKKLFALLICEGKKPDRPCKSLNTAAAAYHKTYLKPIRAWLKGKRPDPLAATVLYPFSGGDLVSAVTTLGFEARNS